MDINLISDKLQNIDIYAARQLLEIKDRKKFYTLDKFLEEKEQNKDKNIKELANILRKGFSLILKGNTSKKIERILTEIVKKDPFIFVLTFNSFNMNYFSYHPIIGKKICFLDMKGSLTKIGNINKDGIVYGLYCKYFPKNIKSSWIEILFNAILFINSQKCNSSWENALRRICPKSLIDIEDVIVENLCNIILRSDHSEYFISIEEMSFISGLLGAYSFISPYIDESKQGIYPQSGKIYFYDITNQKLIERIIILKKRIEKGVSKISKDFFSFSFFRVPDSVDISKSNLKELKVKGAFGNYLKHQLNWWEDMIIK